MANQPRQRNSRISVRSEGARPDAGRAAPTFDTEAAVAVDDAGAAAPSDTPEASGPGPASPPPQARRRRGRRLALLAVGVVLVTAGAVAVLAELQTSTLQSQLFSRLARDATWTVEPGAAPAPLSAGPGPHDLRLGYTQLPRMVESAGGRGFQVAAQARVSPGLQGLVDRGLFPPYREKLQGGLQVAGAGGREVHAAPYPARVYPAFDAIPELVWRTLLYIESRELLDPRYPRRNPAVEWDRLARGVLELGRRALGSDRNVPGGSTLATQLEKFRHSPEGRTSSPTDKLVQMASASVRAYLDGPETLGAQRRIVVDYLNSVPLAAQRGHGEVTGLADGLHAWFGTEFDEANRVLAGMDPDDGARRALIYRQVLSLMVAHRRPSYFLIQAAGKEELERLTDEHLELLAREEVLPPGLAAAALAADVELLPRAPARPPVPFVARKAANQVRTELLGLLGVPTLYELDRFDLRVEATLEMAWQEAVGSLLDSLTQPDFVRARGLAVPRMLARGDPSLVLYSFTLLETTPHGNLVRVQTDNFDGPLSLSASGRLELGSTSKLRTLVTYLEVIEVLHGSLSALSPDSIRAVASRADGRDRLTRWVADHLLARPGSDLSATLRAAMGRTWSASPAERFATGGGVQTFQNFDRTFDGRSLDAWEAFRQSVNLPFVRMMREVVHHHMYGRASTAGVLEDVNDPARRDYLVRFADEEGSRFVSRFYRKYQGRSGPEILETLLQERRLTPQRIAWALRTVAPEASLEVFTEAVEAHTPNTSVAAPAAADLYRTTDPSRWGLADLGYLARIHPLELWVVRYLLDHPGASGSEVLAGSAEARQEVYQWLFRTRSRNAQDVRIRSILEMEAFAEVLRAWKAVGYPFENIVPSFGTAIGSSGDRPAALAELLGIILNDGVRYPALRVQALHFAEGTPFETHLERTAPEGERVLSTEVASVLREALVDVVERGTARRVRGAARDVDGTTLAIGGKTGTGDNRFRVFAPGGGLAADRIVNRTATFAFFLGDRYFGVVTAYVPGAEAAGYDFTSGLPSEVLRLALQRLELPAPPGEETDQGG